MENFNIGEVLKFAPKGLKLYSPLIGEVEFNQIMDDAYYIRVKMIDEYYSFTKHGRYIVNRGECLLFPSVSHRTWDNWQNILLPQSIGSVCIDTNAFKPIMFLCTSCGTVFVDNTCNGWDFLLNIGGSYLTTSRYATDEESKQFFDELKANGYKWDGKDVIKITSTFKEGDWVVDNCGYVWKIEGILNQFYLLESVEGAESRPTIKWVDNTFHLWSIEDTKDGDVLCSGQMILLFKQWEDNADYNFVIAHAGIDTSSKLQITDEHWLISNYAHPATKEQRELLFQKMKEAGYEWNDEKKELKKIEQSYNNDRVDEQEFVDWNADDSKKIETLRSIIFDYAFYKDALDENNDLTGEYNELDNWLTTLPERFNFERFNFLPKQKLSEKDKKLLIDTYIMLDWYKGNNWPKSQYIKDLLNSNKQQNNWKPSDLQIEALESATENCAYSEYQDCLRDLIKQLKKLK